MQSNFVNDRSGPSSPRRSKRERRKTPSLTAAVALSVLLSQGACMTGGESDTPLSSVELAKSSLIQANEVPAPIAAPAMCGTIQSLDSYAIYAKSSITLGKKSEVHGGNVGVHQAGAAPVLTLAQSASVDKSAVAPSIRLASGSSVTGPIFLSGGALTPPGNGAHGAINPFPNNTPALPNVAAFSSVSTPVISVSSGGTVGDNNPVGDVPVPPASGYGDVAVGAGGTLILAGGSYQFRNLKLNAGAKLYALAPTTIDVAEKIDLGAGAQINQQPGSGQAAKNFILRTAYPPQINGGSAVDVVTLGKGAVVRALLLAPNGIVQVRNSVSFTGALVGDVVNVAGVGDGGDISVTPAKFIWEDAFGSDVCSELCGPSFTTNVANDTITSGTISYFDGVFEAGNYLAKYEDGCMKYNGSYNWSLHAIAPSYAWFVVGDNMTSHPPIEALLPGTQGYLVGHEPLGFDSFQACVDANLALPPLGFAHPGGRLGIYLSDEPYDDNELGAANPTWNVTRYVPKGTCVQ